MQKSATSSPSGKRFKDTLSPGEPISCDVLIIGAGYTGCSAAHNLYFKHDIKDIHVVDSFSHLGGRAFSYSSNSVTSTAGLALPNLKDGQPNRYENGAQYIGDDQPTIMNLIKDLGMGADLQDGFELRKPWKQQVTLLDQGRRYSYNREIGLFGNGGIPPNLSFWDAIATQLMIANIQSIERKINVVEPWNSAADVLKYDNITMAEFLDRAWMTPNAKQLINLAVQGPLSVLASEISGAPFSSSHLALTTTLALTATFTLSHTTLALPHPVIALTPL